MRNIKRYLKENIIFIVLAVLIDICFVFYSCKFNDSNIINFISVVLINLLCFVNGKIDLSDKFYFFINSILSLFLMNVVLKISTIHIDFLYLVLNFLIVYSIYLFFNIFKMHSIFKIILTNIIFIAFALGEYYILEFKGVPLVLRDLATINVGVSVMGTYTFLFDKIFVVGILILLFMLILSFKINVYSFNFLSRGKSFISYFLITIYSFSMMNSFVIDSSALQKYGPLLSFISDYKLINVKEPENYNRDEVEKILNNIYSDVESNNEEFKAFDFKQIFIKEKEERKPNIIVIMSEALFDFERVDKTIKTNKDYMPYLHNFKNLENTFTGYVTTPIFGGGTCNSEFEFLTNHSMSFLGRWVYPYQDYIETKQDTIVRTLKDYGYKNIAVHAFKGESWRRTEVYDLMGFDDFIYQDKFDKNVEKYRGMITDKAMFNKIIEVDESIDDPLFVFGVTMQNHGGYNYGYKGDIKVLSDDNYNYSSANEYFSLVKKSDDAFKELIEYYKKSDEDTIILMFGDHSPAFVYNDLIRNNDIDVASYREHYDTPFYMWANFDIEDGYEDNISLNYLNLLLFEQAGLKFNNYQKYLSNLRKEYPNINVFMETNNDKNLEEYKNLQYYMLFDKYKEKTEN